MPLSENEERILAEIERQLAAEDPRFVARARRRRSVSRSTRLRLAIALGVLGVIGLFSLAFGPFGPWVAAGGMVLLFVSILLGVTALTERPQQQEAFVPPDERS